MSKKLLIFGGSFDPPHEGHRLMLQAASKAVSPDEIIVIPCYIQPIKDIQSASAEHRLNMTRLLFADEDIEVSDYEMKKGGPSYTIDTVRHFIEVNGGDCEVFLLIGQDSYETFDKWKDYKKLLDMCRLVVVSREISKNEYSVIEEGKNIFLKGFYHPANSTDIRSGVQVSTPEIMKYIKENSLYKAG
ncbi:MAG: nicotinate (nicotinamide) nucleotide adenylyltransferase [Pseudomonadota bacterium]